MIENCALYLPIEKPPLKKLIPHGKTDGRLFRSPSWFEYQTDDGPVKLTLQHPNLQDHLRGLRTYVAQQPNSGASRETAQKLIQKTRIAIGVHLPKPVAPESDAFASLMFLIERFGGFMFVANSVLLPDGSFLVGPMANEDNMDEQPPEVAKVPVNPDDLRHIGSTEGVEPTRVSMRERHYCELAERGFRCARSLPLYRSDETEDKIRPVPEIAGRLMALRALFLWVSASEDVASTGELLESVERNALERYLTNEENEIRLLPRAQAHDQHTDTIGWRLENMWALAWILGFDPAPPFFRGQLSQDVIQRIVMEFLPGFDEGFDAFVASLSPRTPAEVSELEDLFYCTHNAVRSAQLGEDSVPTWFHPVRDGGAIHERRHALTWALSPGSEWDETDLST